LRGVGQEVSTYKQPLGSAAVPWACAKIVLGRRIAPRVCTYPTESEGGVLSAILLPLFLPNFLAQDGIGHYEHSTTSAVEARKR
jgi:hypothetical protein